MGSNILSSGEFDTCYEMTEKLELIINPPEIPLSETDPEHCCHLCGCYTELKCTFDKEMNPYSEPSPCCGCGSCAEDV